MTDFSMVAKERAMTNLSALTQTSQSLSPMNARVAPLQSGQTARVIKMRPLQLSRSIEAAA